MRNITIKFITLIMVLTMVNTISYSTDFASVNKIREEANNASPEDWYTLAECADRLISKGKNLEEAKTWILQSIEISERRYNYMLLGDYYRMIKYPEKAIDYYVMALRLANNYSEISDGEIQWRIGTIVLPHLYEK